MRSEAGNFIYNPINFQNPRPLQSQCFIIHSDKKGTLREEDKVRINAFIRQLEQLWDWQCLIEVQDLDKDYARRVADTVRQYVISLRQAPERFLRRAVRSDGINRFRFKKTRKLTLVFMLVKKFSQKELGDIRIDTLHPGVGQTMDISYLSLGMFEHQKSYPGISPYYDSITMTINALNRYNLLLESHSDCRAAPGYNLSLTQRRIDTIKAILSRHGADTLGIRAIGKGESGLYLPECNCDLHDYGNKICTEVQHQLNRRIVLRIIGRKIE